MENYIFETDLITINGQRYFKSDPVRIKQILTPDKFCRVNVTIPAYISGRLIYKDVLFMATKQINDVIRFTNTYDYWVIDYYPSKDYLKLHNSLLETIPNLTDAERELVKQS